MTARSRTEQAARLTRLEAQARRAFRAGDAPALEATCRQILDGDKHNLLALELLGAAALHRGELGRAEAVFRRAAEAHPREARIVNTLGVVLARRNRPAEAIDCYRWSMALNPNYARPRINLGNALCGQGRFEDGMSAYHEALALEPASAEAHLCLGNALRELGQTDAAADSYRRALAAQPELGDAQINLGALLCDQGRLDEAAGWLGRALDKDPQSAAGLLNMGILRCRQDNWAAAAALLRRAREVQPGNPRILWQLGRALAALERWDEALAAFEGAAAVDPGPVELHLDMGDLYKATQRWHEAIAAYLRALELDPEQARRLKHYDLGLACALTGDYGTAAAAMLAPVERFQGRQAELAVDPLQKVSRVKLLHDAGQLDYLRAAGRLGPDYDPVIAEYREVLSEPTPAGPPEFVEVRAGSHPRLAANLYRLNHLAEAPALPGGALNKHLDWAAVEAAYAAAPPGATYVDDLLCPEALASLQRFCLESTVWWQLEHASEVGSTQAAGFACPLLLQIAQELRQALPGVLGPHPFTTMWAYKYFDLPGREGELNRSTGRAIHADAGVASVNLWITPDEANLGPEPGGVQFWDEVAPASYFAGTTRSERQEMLRPFVESAGPPRLVLPHRCNRAAVFHSNLLHRSSPQRFRDAYADRKISITMMFGRQKTGG